ncbi:MAG TPA: insulinase family protein [Gemmatimonadaceae bacterium]|nr:insulinase family protein [Gemmatimonadaceae bacterium]
MIRSVRAALLFALVSTPAVAQQPATPPPTASSVASLHSRLPVDPKVRIGTLPNGLRYYIRQNARPEKRAELRLVVNAGSVLETPDQLGLAHFVEHTAFNGTTHFKKNDLVKYLQSIGVRFGADLNAYTSFDETVYILPIPTDTARIVDQAFTILEDWAHGQLFDPTEVTNERGVVREEWRGRRGAGDRMLQQWLPIAFKGSRYAERLPIGTEQSIMAATPAKLRAFYNNWYRPDLMAVVAVGDFDPNAIEAKIKQHFSKLKTRPNPPKRPTYDVPANKEPLVAIASDKEATSSSVNIFYKMPATKVETVADYRTMLIERLYLQMLNSRFSEITQKPDAPFLAAGASKSSFFARNAETFSLAANVKDGGVDRAVEALLTEARRVDQFGFLETELDRVKQDLLRGYERSFAEREKTQSAAFVEEYIGNYLEGESIPGIEYEYKITQQLVPTVTLADVNQLARRWITDENRVIIAQTPVKENVPLPTQGGILAAFDRANKATVVAYTENLSAEKLIETPPAAGKVVSSRAIPGIGATEWKLSNGARVIIKPTDFKADEVLFSAYSPGGHSLVPDPDFMSAAMASQVISMGGVGSFNAIDLEKKLTGKVANVTPSIGETTEGLVGNSSPKDIETMFQLAYLKMTAPRLDTVRFAAFKNQVAPFLANRSLAPSEVFSDTVQVTMAQNAFRARAMTPTVFAEVNPQKALAVYKDRFADAGDFTFVLVGNVDTVAIKPYVETYLASLPSSGRKEKARDTGIVPPKGLVQKVVRKGSEPKATTNLIFTGACTYNPESRFVLRALTSMMRTRLTESLREKLGGTYSPSVDGGCQREPRNLYSIQISYGSSPENVEPLTKAVLALIDSVKTITASAADVDKVKEEILRSREVEVKTNMYWLGNIAARDQAGEDFAGLGPAYDEMVRKLTPAMIQQAARTYFNTTNYARFVLLPETAAATK